MRIIQCIHGDKEYEKIKIKNAGYRHQYMHLLERKMEQCFPED